MWRSFIPSHSISDVSDFFFPEELPKGGGASPTSPQCGESLVSTLSPQAGEGWWETMVIQTNWWWETMVSQQLRGFVMGKQPTGDRSCFRWKIKQQEIDESRDAPRYDVWTLMTIGSWKSSMAILRILYKWRFLDGRSSINEAFSIGTFDY